MSSKRIRAKTACNLWGEVTKGFSDARELNDSTLRVRLDNPTEHVRGPARGDDRQKPLLRPNELVELQLVQTKRKARFLGFLCEGGDLNPYILSDART